MAFIDTPGPVRQFGLTRGGRAWRKWLQPASFRGARFHVEAGGKESGRRIVVHEFPKKDMPYAEDMGRRAIEFTVRGYCIQYPFDATSSMSPLYMMDYTIPRNILIAELEKEGVGKLQLPLLPPLTVVCQRYRLTEEEARGGYCTFDMGFVEYGLPPFQPMVETRNDVVTQAQRLRDTVVTALDKGFSV